MELLPERQRRFGRQAKIEDAIQKNLFESYTRTEAYKYLHSKD